MCHREHKHQKEDSVAGGGKWKNTGKSSEQKDSGNEANYKLEFFKYKKNKQSYLITFKIMLLWSNNMLPI